MKNKYIWSLIGTVLAFFIADRSITYGLNQLVIQSGNRFSQLYNPHKTIDADILIIGNSRGVNGFYTPLMNTQLNKKAFNLSYNEMSIAIAKNLLLDYLGKNKDPEFLLLEITNLNAKNSLINNLKQYSSYSTRIDECLLSENKPAFYAQNFTQLYRFNSEFFLRTLFYLGKESDQDWINRYTMSSSFANEFDPQSVNFYAFNNPERQDISSLKEIISICTARGIKLRMTVSPMFPRYNSAITDKFQSWKSYIETSSGTSIYDYSNTIKDYRYFADPIHMNYDGTTQLLPIMIKDGFFD